MSIYNGWNASEIAFVKSLEWMGNDLTMVFYSQKRGKADVWPDTSKEFNQISLTFKNTSSLKLKFDGYGPQQVSGFEISDVSANGLENINFQIQDYEDDVISFYCKAIEVNEVLDPFIPALIK